MPKILSQVWKFQIPDELSYFLLRHEWRVLRLPRNLNPLKLTAISFSPFKETPLSSSKSEEKSFGSSRTESFCFVLKNRLNCRGHVKIPKYLFIFHGYSFIKRVNHTEIKKTIVRLENYLQTIGTVNFIQRFIPFIH